MSKEIKEAAQQQAEEAFDGFMVWMKRDFHKPLLSQMPVIMLIAMIFGMMFLAH